MTVRKLLILLVAVCVLVPAATAVLAGASDATSDAIPVRSDELSDLADEMEILRDPSETDGPVEVSELDGAPIMADDVIELADAREVADSDLLVAPTTDDTGLCVAGPGRMTCGSADQIAEHGAAPAVTWNAEGEVHLIGLTTDGVASVTVVYDDGTVQEIDASTNVLDAVLKDKPVEVRWDGPQGAEQHLVLSGQVDVP